MKTAEVCSCVSLFFKNRADKDVNDKWWGLVSKIVALYGHLYVQKKFKNDLKITFAPERAHI